MTMTTIFSELIERMDGGTLNADLSEQTRALMRVLSERAARAGGEVKGQISLTLKFAATSNGRVTVEAEAPVKAPGVAKVKETLWISEDGDLRREDPRQERLFVAKERQ